MGELNPEDVFSLVEFNSVIKVWNIESNKVSYQEGESSYFFYGNSKDAEVQDKKPKVSYKC